MTRVQYRKFQTFIRWYAVISVAIMLSIIAYNQLSH